MTTIQALGGSGENGRNCYAVSDDTECFLFDCGVKREVYGDRVGDYPLLTRELVQSLEAVFLSHVHEDHCAALPLLARYGYRGPVCASEESIESVYSYIHKWMRFVRNRGGRLPYDEADVRALSFVPLRPGWNTLPAGKGKTARTVCCGRTGHMLGSLWFALTLDGHRFFYSGDIVSHPLLLKQDRPEPADTVILDCGYAGSTMRQEEQTGRLLEEIRSTLSAGGKVLLPLPPKGRGADLLVLVARTFPQVPIYADTEFREYVSFLLERKDWLQDGVSLPAAENVHYVQNDGERHAVCGQKGPALILSQDGMLAAPQGLVYYNALKGDARSKVIVTGHTGKGTEGSLLWDDAYCRENGIRIRRCRIIYKVHFDAGDLLDGIRILRPRRVVLFHAPRADCTAVLERLSGLGIDARCLSPGEIWNF